MVSLRSSGTTSAFVFASSFRTRAEPFRSRTESQTGPESSSSSELRVRNRIRASLVVAQELVAKVVDDEAVVSREGPDGRGEVGLVRQRQPREVGGRGPPLGSLLDDVDLRGSQPQPDVLEQLACLGRRQGELTLGEFDELAVGPQAPERQFGLRSRPQGDLAPRRDHVDHRSEQLVGPLRADQVDVVDDEHERTPLLERLTQPRQDHALHVRSGARQRCRDLGVERLDCVDRVDHRPGEALRGRRGGARPGPTRRGARRRPPIRTGRSSSRTRRER